MSNFELPKRPALYEVFIKDEFFDTFIRDFNNFCRHELYNINGKESSYDSYEQCYYTYKRLITNSSNNFIRLLIEHLEISKHKIVSGIKLQIIIYLHDTFLYTHAQKCLRQLEKVDKYFKENHAKSKVDIQKEYSKRIINYLSIQQSLLTVAISKYNKNPFSYFHKIKEDLFTHGIKYFLTFILGALLTYLLGLLTK